MSPTRAIAPNAGPQTRALSRRVLLLTLALSVAVGLTVIAGCSDDSGAPADGAANNGAANNGGGNNGSDQNNRDRLFDVPACNYRDDPTSCEGWRCYRDERGQICERSRPDEPDGRDGWTCSDDANPGYTTCWRDDGRNGDDPNGGTGWTCRNDANNDLICTQDDPGGYGDPNGGDGANGDDEGGNGYWDCYYNAQNQLECARTDGPNGGDGWVCHDDARGSHCTGTITDNPGGNNGGPGDGGVAANDEPSGGGWVCVTNGDTRVCDNDHGDDQPGQASDNPSGGPGWTCRDTNDGRVCAYDDPSGDGGTGGNNNNGTGDDPYGTNVGPRDPGGSGYDTPDGGDGWECLIENGVKSCRLVDDPGGANNGGGPNNGTGGNNGTGVNNGTGGNNGTGVNNGTGGDDNGGGGRDWNCTYDPDTGRTTCIATPDVPTDDPGWDCVQSEDRRICVNDDPDGPGDPGNPGVDDCGNPVGNVQGRVCAPSGDYWVVGATVSVTFTDCNGQPKTVTTQTDAEGYFILTGVGVGTHEITVVKGPYSASFTVEIVGGQTTTIPLGDFCFDQSTNIAVITGQYDRISLVLDDLGFTYDLFDGYPENNGTRELLGDLGRMMDYDVIFMNCGSTIRGVLDNPDVRNAVASNMEAYVAAGGHFYISDWDYEFEELAFADKIDFAGTDTARFDVLGGASGFRGATVVDSQLLQVLGENRVTLNFDYPAWAVVEGVAADVRVFLKADVELLRGGIKRDVPVLMSFKYGEGEVIFTSYHIHQNDTINDIFTFTVLGFE